VPASTNRKFAPGQLHLREKREVAGPLDSAESPLFIPPKVCDEEVGGRSALERGKRERLMVLMMEEKKLQLSRKKKKNWGPFKN